LLLLYFEHYCKSAIFSAVETEGIVK